MSLFIQRMFDGLAEGSIYALLALALVVIFRSTGQLNFAQGEIGTLCAFFASTMTLAGWPVWLAILGGDGDRIPDHTRSSNGSSSARSRIATRGR